MPKRTNRDRPPRVAALTVPKPANELAQLLDSSDLALVVPQLAPETLHRIIHESGLEACGDLVVAATPQQLTSLFDLDLWRHPQPGLDEQFDADRFGDWLEVLVGAGDAVAARTVAGLDSALIVAGLSRFIRVFDPGTFVSSASSDDEPFEGAAGSPAVYECELGGYLVRATKSDAWDAIVALLVALDVDHSAYFHAVMRGCQQLSDSGRELDGLDALLEAPEQWLYEVATDREGRRSEQGYSTPAEARAFLDAARRRPHVATADSFAGTSLPPPFPGALEPIRSHLSPIQELMAYLRDHDETAYFARSGELALLANMLVAGCSVQSRSFTPHEASEAAIATCNLGLERRSGAMLPHSFLSDHDLIAAFEIGWTTLHEEVGLDVATRLMDVLTDLECVDAGIQRDLQGLRRELRRQCDARTPWHARGSLDAIAMLDMPAWASLTGLLDECPVMPAAVTAILGKQATAVSSTAFEFISTSRQIAVIHQFAEQLGMVLRD